MQNNRHGNLLHYLLGFLVLVIYILPYAILGTNSYLEIHDMLDGAFVYKILLAKYSGLYQKNIIIADIMNGVPLSSLGSAELNVVTFIFKLFPPFTAYVVNDFTVRFIAFAGTYALLNRHLRYGDESRSTVFSFLIAVVFSLVPFYTIYGICSAGIPMLLYAFLNLLQKEKVLISYLLIVFFCIYSSLVLVGVFVLPCLGLIWLIDIFKRRKANMLFLGGMVLMLFCYVFFEHLLLEEFTRKDGVVLHRSIWKVTGPSAKMLKDTVKVFFENQYHAGEYMTLPILIAAAVLFVIAWRKKEKLGKRFYFSLLAVAGLTFFVLASKILQPLLAKKISVFVSFQIDRFYFMLPAAWIVLFAVVIFELASRKVNRIILYALVLFQGIIVINGDKTYKRNVVAMAGVKSTTPNFKEFYASAAFAKMDTYINRDKTTYRVASIGMHPSAAQYNGFYTIDAYINLYPLQYMHDFRKIMEKELAKNERIRTYFDGWGNRCYIFPSELDRRLLKFTKNDKTRIANMELDAGQLKKLGCEYIISVVPIDNPEKSGLRFLQMFTDKDSYYNLYLFAVV